MQSRSQIFAYSQLRTELLRGSNIELKADWFDPVKSLFLQMYVVHFWYKQNFIIISDILCLSKHRLHCYTHMLRMFS